MTPALLGCQETQPLFQDTFSVLLFNPAVGKTQVCVGKGCCCAHPTVPLALHLQMRAKGEPGWNTLVPAYPQLGYWPESALGSPYKKRHRISKSVRAKWHQHSQATAWESGWWPGWEETHPTPHQNSRHQAVSHFFFCLLTTHFG